MASSSSRRQAAYALLAVAGFVGVALLSTGPDWGRLFQTSLLAQEGPPPMDMPPPPPPMDRPPPPPPADMPPLPNYQPPGTPPPGTPPPDGTPPPAGTPPPDGAVPPPAGTPQPSGTTSTPTTAPGTALPQNTYTPPTSSSSSYVPADKQRFLQQFQGGASFSLKNYRQQQSNTTFSPGQVPAQPQPFTQPQTPTTSAPTTEPPLDSAPTPPPTDPAVQPTADPATMTPPAVMPSPEQMERIRSQYRQQAPGTYAAPTAMPAYGMPAFRSDQLIKDTLFEDDYFDYQQEGPGAEQRPAFSPVCQQLKGRVQFKRNELRFNNDPGFASCVANLESIAQSCDPSSDNYDLMEDFNETEQQCGLSMGKQKMAEGLSHMRREMERLQASGVDMSEGFECLADISVDDISAPEDFEIFGETMQECGEMIREAYEQKSESFMLKNLNFLADDIRRGLAQLDASNLDEETKQACIALGNDTIGLIESQPLDALDDEQREDLMVQVEEAGMEAEELGCMEAEDRDFDDYADDFGFDEEDEDDVAEIVNRFSKDKSRDIMQTMLTLNKDKLATLAKGDKTLAQNTLTALSNLKQTRANVDGDALLEQNQKLAQQVKLFEEKVQRLERGLAAQLENMENKLTSITFTVTDGSEVLAKCHAALEVAESAGVDAASLAKIASKCDVDADKAIAHEKDEALKSGAIAFREIDPKDWHAAYFTKAKEKGVFTGDRDSVTGELTGTVRPSAPVNMAELLKVSFAANDVTVSAPQEGEEWFAPYVEAARTLGVDQGLSPSATPNRGQVAQVLMGIAGGTPTGLECGTFNDVKASDARCSAIEWMNKKGVMQGDRDANGNRTYTFRPNDEINRAEIAKIVDTLFKN